MPLKVKKYVRAVSHWIPSGVYLWAMHYWRTKKVLNLRNPKTYTEKLQWLKLHDRKSIYSTMVDKCEAKKYVADRIGEEHIVPLLGVWDNPDKINFDELPEQFVLKCTHDSGGYVICRNKRELDISATKKKLGELQSRNFYWHGREWAYRNIKPRIIAERFMTDTKLCDLRDYKFFTFGGEPKIVHIVSNRQRQDEETYGDFFDMDYNHLDLTMGHDNAPVLPEKPKNFDKMKAFAAELAEGTKHLRVDFYEVDEQLYFGELTFFQDCGFSDVQPQKWNDILGSWIVLD